MKIIQVKPDDRRRVKQFIQLPFEIYREIPNWVPPLSIDERQPFNPKNPFYQHSKAAFYLAINDQDQAIGRITILANHNYNQFNQERTAFFWLFECQNDVQVSNGLFEAAFDWARGQGLNKIIGPKGFTPLDGSGLLVKGFKHRPAFGLPYNPPYYPTLIESAGFTSKGDTVSGYLSAKIELPEKIYRVAERVKERRGLRVVTYRTRGDLRALVPILGELYNNSLANTEGTVPLTNQEAATMANQLLWFADPKLIKIIMRGEEPIGFLFAYPDVSAAIQRIKGRIFPFGWVQVLRELKRTEWVNVNGAGIIEKYRGLGGTALLFSEMAKSIHQGNFKHADLVQIGVENSNMQRELRGLGVDFYKAHRVYERSL